MKRLTLLAIFLATLLSAKPAILGGFSYSFGSSEDSLANAGATVKVISSAQKNKAVVGAGVSYYPWAKGNKQFGVDVSAGYTFKDGAVMGGWDFIKNQPSISLGYSKEIDTDDDKEEAAIQDARCKKDKK